MDHSSWLLIHQTSKRNNAGVKAFAVGDKELAIEHLNGALVIINKLLLLHCDQYDLASRILRSQGGDAAESSPESQDDDISVRPKTQTIDALDDNRFYIFNQALMFSAPSQGCGSVTNSQEFDRIRTCYIQVSFFWSIVHFNMALVLHRLIHESPENSKRYREEAILFYKLCLQNLWVIPGKSATMNLLMLCAVNNLAHVYLNLHSCTGEPASANTSVAPLPTCCGSSLETATAQAMALPFHQSELIQGLLLRSIGKVIANERSLTEEQQKQVTEMSVNHIVISALSPSYMAPGA